MLACLCTVKLQKEAVCLYYVYLLYKMYCCYKSGKSQGNSQGINNWSSKSRKSQGILRYYD